MDTLTIRRRLLRADQASSLLARAEAFVARAPRTCGAALAQKLRDEIVEFLDKSNL